MSDTLIVAALWTYIGFQWGDWWAGRRAKKDAAAGEAAFKLLFRMVKGIIDKRQFIGRGLTISRQERFEVLGERFSITIQSDGDPQEVEREAA